MNDLPPTANQVRTALISLTADVVSAYVANNSVPVTELSGLVASVHAALARLGDRTAQPAEKPVPPVPIKKSITPDAIISLEDGRPYKTLKRHLTGRGLTPQQYREKWGLPTDYPMIAPNYSNQRSELAKASGLGANRRRQAAKAAEPNTIVRAPTKRRVRLKAD